MIDFFTRLQFGSVLELVVLALIAGYLVFSFLALRQIGVLVDNVKTNLSRVIYLLGMANLVLGALALVASLALVF